MPFLRQEPDNTLAETLGNLGSGLSNALNPLNQIRANDMMAQMQERRWQMQHQQTLDAANRNAADVWVTANPLHQDDATLAATAAQIRNGQYPIGTANDAIIAATKFKAAQAASDTVNNDPTMSGWSDTDKASAHAAILSGMTSGEVKQKQADGTLSQAKTSAALGAQKAVVAAVPAGADPETAAVAGSQALTNPADAETTLNKQRALQGATMPAVPLDSPDLSVQNIRERIAGLTPAPLAQELPAQVQADINRKALEGAVTPHAPSTVTTPVGSDTDSIDALTGKKVPAGTKFAINVPRTAPDTSATAGTAAAETTGKAGADYANSQLTNGIQEGQERARHRARREETFAILPR